MFYLCRQGSDQLEIDITGEQFGSAEPGPDPSLPCSGRDQRISELKRIGAQMPDLTLFLDTISKMFQLE